VNRLYELGHQLLGNALREDVDHLICFFVEELVQTPLTAEDWVLFKPKFDECLFELSFGLQTLAVGLVLP
jgi:hypothetical protein